MTCPDAEVSRAHSVSRPISHARTRGAHARQDRPSRHSGQLEDLDVEGIPVFAERVLPAPQNLWVQAPLDQRQRFQQPFFPDGIAFDGNQIVRTGATAPAFSYLREIQTGKEGLVDQTGIEPVTS